MTASNFNKNYPHYNMPVKRYYYVVFSYMGKTYVWYLPDCYNEAQAQRKAQMKVRDAQGNPLTHQVINRPYKDESATRVAGELKADMLNNTGNVEGAVQRMKHTDIKEDNNTDNDGFGGKTEWKPV
jgi:hypothetical protein